jgi:ribosomal protein S18 acetylase RimI-like enzyme
VARHEAAVYGLRDATEADREFLWGLHSRAMRGPVERTWGWDEGFQRGFFDEHFDPAGRRIVVVDGRDVGVLQTEQRKDSHFLANVEISPPFQGQGVGTAIVRDLVAEARTRGVPVTLQVLKENPGARRLYERLGFAVTGETETSHQMSTAGAPEGSPI